MISPRQKRLVSSAASIGLAFGGLIGLIYGFSAYVDFRVERLVSSDTFLHRLADSVRPSCIFDQSGSILNDMGAMAYIDNIDLAATTKDDWLPPKITVHPNRYLANAPLLSTIDGYSIQVSATRGRKFDWIYSINYVGNAVSDMHYIRYRLEILH